MMTHRWEGEYALLLAGRFLVLGALPLLPRKASKYGTKDAKSSIACWTLSEPVTAGLFDSGATRDSP